jgi:recombination protein RecT
VSPSEITKEIEARQAPKEARNAADLILAHPEQLRRVGVDPERWSRIVLSEYRRNDKLLDCDPNSMAAAAILAATLGLEPGPLGLFYLVPFGREVVPIIGYRGYVELAYRSGLVKSVWGDLVHDGDLFRVQKGSRRALLHEPAGAPGEREIVAAYAGADLKSGGQVWRVIYEEDWERARQASPAGKRGSGPWKDDRPAMILKTAFRRLEPLLPKAAGLERAFSVDEVPVRDEADVLEVEGLTQ